ncbi:MAG: DHH family phosphoesterase [Methanomethylophilus sp.]
MDDSVLPPKLLSALSKAADLVRGHQYIQLFSHYDTDGITAAAIAAKALYRAGKEFRVTIMQTLDDANMAVIAGTKAECILITDLGASFIKQLDSLPCDVIVLDHHTLGDLPERLCYANPHLYGIDGMSSGCGATMAFLFAITLDERNWDLAPVAMAGVAGDRQHLHGVSGLNTFLLNGAVKRKHVVTMPGSLIPVGNLSSELFMSADPYIRGVSGSPAGTEKFLAEADIPAGKDYRDLTDDERERLSSLIAVKLTTQGTSRAKMEEAARARYYLPAWNTDAETLASQLNACGRLGLAGIGVAAGMGDPRCLDRARELDAQSKKDTMEGVLAVDSDRLNQLDHIQWFDSSASGFTGMVAGVVMNYIGDPQKPTVGINTSDPIAKVSSRGTDAQLAAGIDLADALKRSCAAVGGLGGGHRIASGGSFPSPRREEFLAKLNGIVGEQLAAHQKN